MAKILYLGVESELIQFLESDGNSVFCTANPIDEDMVINNKFDFIVSYRYKFILPEQILRHFEDAAVNLHTSLLPFNRGYDPNFWSFVDGTPNGVSIHYMTAKLDKGNIIVQKKIVFDAKLHTFESSYEVLQENIKQLFKENWDSIKNKTCPKIPQESLWDGKGTYHRSTDKNELLPFLKNGWATNVAEFLEILKENKAI
ncbi:formyltransferase family protein [Campylobacter concisus]|uniref:formyltransferase family protein n=1 Tax=Campylobacter concisus TaxID=199 RepID=UPI000D38F786|nr:formyltransferase family protein [Campylobacter concisus]QPH94518.1 formyl transferase [Campylobacter concisus]